MSSILNFIFVKDLSIWQDLFWSSLLIPLAIYFFSKLRQCWVNNQPLHSLLKSFINSGKEIVVFVSQLSQADTLWNKVSTPQYIQLYPCPTPTDHNQRCKILNPNIDPVWSETDGLCVADVFSVMGSSGIKKDIRIGNLISDWNERTSPIVSIGFNAKTRKLMTECHPINYNLEDSSPGYLSIEGSKVKLDAIIPNDAGIIQKTFIKNTRVPVIILAGLGTTGTATAGYFFRQNAINLGKLYGNKSFCVLLKTSLDKGKNLYTIRAIYPKPNLGKAFLYPVTYRKWYKKGIFPTIEHN